MNYRRALEKDAEQLSRLNNLFNNVLVSPEHIVRVLQEETEIVIVAEEDDDIYGFICGQLFSSLCYTTNVMEITELYISEKARGMGLGGQLIQKIEAIGDEKNVGQIRIETGLENIAAQKLYTKAGYTKINEVVLEKKLR